MSLRQIALDTETTGIRVEDGHRVIEIGCVELINRKLTGRHFHYYLNPERVVDAGAVAVHGLTNDFLRDKPLFESIADEFIAFIADAEVIIHNAPFDVSFLNHELKFLNRGLKPFAEYCQIIDTLPMARKRHVGQRNSLDALCKRYGVDHSKRELHGALLDANLLAQVYLAMTGGQGNFFDALSEHPVSELNDAHSNMTGAGHHYEVILLKANENELLQHKRYLESMSARGKCLWESEN
jgi:DNA polymerase-3 subunit epsilon